MREPHPEEHSERHDPRLWRIQQLPQSGYRSRWSLHVQILVGVLVLGAWLMAGLLWQAWGLGLILVPIGAFLMVWGIIQEVLAILSMETFGPPRNTKKR